MIFTTCFITVEHFFSSQKIGLGYDRVDLWNIIEWIKERIMTCYWLNRSIQLNLNIFLAECRIKLPKFLIPMKTRKSESSFNLENELELEVVVSASVAKLTKDCHDIQGVFTVPTSTEDSVNPNFKHASTFCFLNK